jgi:hypothetical protein
MISDDLLNGIFRAFAGVIQKVVARKGSREVLTIWA